MISVVDCHHKVKNEPTKVSMAGCVPWLAQQVKYVFQDAAVFSAAVLDMSQELNVETVGTVAFRIRALR